MRCRPLRWLWGLLPIVAWGVLVALGEQKNIEADLTERAKAALLANDLGWAETTVSGRDVVVAGKATEDGEPLQASGLVEKVWGVRSVDNRAGLIETADVYVWGASLRNNRVRLTGFVPNDETRRTIFGVAQAIFPNREIQDQTKPARGAPPRDAWLGGVSFALKQLALLKRGSVDLDRTSLAIEGEAVDSKSFLALKSALSTGLPAGVTVKEDRVLPPVISPFLWSMAYDGRQITVAGNLPIDQSRRDVADALRVAFPRALLTDRSEVATGEPKAMVATVLALIPTLAPLGEAVVEFRDANISLTGVAPTDAVANAVHEAAKAAVAGSVFRLTDQIKFKEAVPKPVSPFVTTVAVDGGVANLMGYAPGEPQRAQLLDAVRARLPGIRINDQLAVAGGAPDGWLPCLDAGLATLPRLKGGSLKLADKALTVGGSIADEDVHAALPAELKAAANRSCETQFDVALDTPPEPNLRWRAVRTTSELVLEGTVPGDQAKADLAAAAAQAFPGVPVDDRTTAAPGASQKWSRTAEAGLKALAKLRSGEAVIDQQTLTVSGEAADAAKAQAVKDLVGRGLPRGYTGREQVALRSDAMIWAEQEAKRKAEEDAKRRAEDEAKRKAQDEANRQRAEAEAQARKAADDDARKAAEEARRKAEVEAIARATPEQRAAATRCTALMSGTAQTGQISFDFESSELKPESFRTLDKLVEIAKTCPDARINIAGHTDALGSSDLNDALSMRRAEAVVDYLVAKGVDKGRLTAAGYGASRPLAPNTSAANRAKNRRIEFRAVPK